MSHSNFIKKFFILLIILIGFSLFLPTIKIFSQEQQYFTITSEGENSEGSNQGGDSHTEYNLLEPLPDGSGEMMTSFESDPTKDTCTFAKYLNIIIKLFLGICAVLAVIMIVYGGLEYMISSTPAEKGAHKSTITNALIGLIIALGAYLLLYTINPRLLNVCFEQELPTVEFQLEEEEETPETAQIESTATPQSGAKYGGCSEGIVTVQTKGGTFYVCQKIANNLKSMVEKAWASGVKLSAGSSFRSKSQQENLRAKNCGGSSNIYNKKAKCSPKTAFPGTSRHENGLAIDFKCNGSLIRDKSNACYVWLKSNSNGLKNLKGEPWHWSIDGR